MTDSRTDSNIGSCDTSEDCAVSMTAAEVSAAVARTAGDKLYLLVIRRTCDGVIFQLEQRGETLDDALIEAIMRIDPSLHAFTDDAFSLILARCYMPDTARYIWPLARPSVIIPYATVTL